MKVYCKITGNRGEDSRPCHVVVYTESDFVIDRMGPYRDKTDAENAVHDRFQAEDWEVEWIYTHEFYRA